MILDRFRLDDRAAVVTGAGRGIGAASAIALAEAGSDVVISSRTEKDLRETADRIEAAGRKAVIVPADLSDLDVVAALADAARESFGRLDVVVNNVGGWMPRPYMETSSRALEKAFRFNVVTAHALTQAATPLMLENDGGVVVNISSVMGRVTGRGHLAYGTAKAALAHMTRLSARDLSPRIRVNAIAAGAVATSGLDLVLADQDIKTRMEQTTPLGRIGEPWEIAATVVFLASPAGGYITGKVLEVDGGIERPNLEQDIPDL